jgi:hypothetical protein
MSMKTTHMTDRPAEADLQPGECALLTLREAMAPGTRVAKVVAASAKNSTHPFTVSKAVEKKLCAALLDMNGEWYRPGQWAATYESCKAIGYKTVMITIEEDPLPVRTMRSAKPNLVESVIWILVEKETPDEGVVVLLYHPTASEPVWPGVFEGCSADGYVFSHADGSMITGPVLAWAEVPGGPRL